MCEILEADSKADLIGKNASDCYPHPDDRAEISERVMAEVPLRRLERELIT